MAQVIPARLAEKPASAPAVGGHLHGVVVERCNRSSAADQAHAAQLLRSLKAARAGADVGDGAAHLLGGDLQAEVVPGLQQTGSCLHQPLPHSPICCLAEVAALGVLLVRPAGCQGDLQIRNGRANQDAQVLLLCKMREDQPLPVSVEQILAAFAGKYQPGAALARL